MNLIHHNFDHNVFVNISILALVSRRLFLWSNRIWTSTGFKNEMLLSIFNCSISLFTEELSLIVSKEKWKSGNWKKKRLKSFNCIFDMMNICLSFNTQHIILFNFVRVPRFLVFLICYSEHTAFNFHFLLHKCVYLKVLQHY